MLVLEYPFATLRQGRYYAGLVCLTPSGLCIATEMHVGIVWLALWQPPAFVMGSICRPFWCASREDGNDGFSV